MAKYINIGDVINVTVTSINTDYGAFVVLPNGESSLIRTNQLSWSNSMLKLSSLSVGDSFDVKVINELPDGKLVLSRKALFANPYTLQVGDCITGTVSKIEHFGILINIGDFTALAPYQELLSNQYVLGENIELIVVKNYIDDKKRRKIVLGTKMFAAEYADETALNSIVTGTYSGKISKGDNWTASITVGKIKIDIPRKRFIEPYQSEIDEDALPIGSSLEFVFAGYNKEYRSPVFDMRPIEKLRKEENIRNLCSQLERGSIVEVEVLDVNYKFAKVLIVGTEVTCNLDRKDLSPNKISKASDEVFVGEKLEVVYLGSDDNGLHFSRAYFVQNRYDENLYLMPIKELLGTMGINENSFIGRVISTKDGLFFTDIISSTSNMANGDGQLLIDPVTGKNISVWMHYRYKGLVIAGKFYKANLELADVDFRREQGSPYIFKVACSQLTEVPNPYEESVSLAFKQHTSPNTNTSVANLLEEVGQNLYTSKKRMFFELLQNADDSAPSEGVQVKLQLENGYFVLTHDGYSFNRHDFESITSAAKSTKSASKKKTGYKGIGFKSVFTNSETVIIKSGGYEFAFDKGLDAYNDFRQFYFHVNDIEDDEAKQAEFLRKYGKFYREFNGVKDIPWQLLPVWNEGFKLPQGYSIFNQPENVCIALRMEELTLSEYEEAVKSVFEEPRFMLFLRNTKRVQLLKNQECLTIQKNKSKDGEIISIVTSFSEDKHDYRIHTIDDISVDDNAFQNAGILILRKERINSRGEKENYFVKIDADGNEKTEVTGIPDRIASAINTSLSFAVQLDDDMHIVPNSSKESSLYAYLPMNEANFKFPFFVNADFIPKSDREGIQLDNPWNQFLFYLIGRGVVELIDKFSSIEELDYLMLLPEQLFETNNLDTKAIAEAFNRGFLEKLKTTPFVISDVGEKATLDSIILDNSGLSDLIGNDAFYKLLDITKHLPHRNLNISMLSKPLYGVESISAEVVFTSLTNDIEKLTEFLNGIPIEKQYEFFNWIKDNHPQKYVDLGLPIMKFANEWLSKKQILELNDYIALTDKLKPISDILPKLGFHISNVFISEHPLSEYIPVFNDKSLFDIIIRKDIAPLDYHSRLSLFEAFKGFDGVGEKTLKDIAIFKNSNGEMAPLGKMLPYREDCPVYLRQYQISRDENAQEIQEYLIKVENEFDDVVWPNRSQIGIDIQAIYDSYPNDWSDANTKEIISGSTSNEQLASILRIVEQSGAPVKKAFIDKIVRLDITEGASYSKESFEYRAIQLALSTLDQPALFAHKIYLGDKQVSTFALSDNLTCKFKEGDVERFIKLPLSQILPQYRDQSVLIGQFKRCFEATKDFNKLFDAKEKPLSEVANELAKLLNLTRNGNWPINAASSPLQYLFDVYYNREIRGYKDSWSNWVLSIDLAKESDSFVREMFDFLFTNKIKFNASPFTYRLTQYLTNHYFKSDFILEGETLMPALEQWADSEEKRKYLIANGVKDETFNVIGARILFLQNQQIEFIEKLSKDDAQSILSFLVYDSDQLPYSGENQIKAIEELQTKWNICSESINVSELVENSKEYSSPEYVEWINGHYPHIFLYCGEMPYFVDFNNQHLIQIRKGDYWYDKSHRRLYINENVDINQLLFAIMREGKSDITSTDYEALCLAGKVIVSKDFQEQSEKKDQRISELEDEVARLRAMLTPTSVNISPATKSMSKERQIEAQLEAQNFLRQTRQDWSYPNGFGRRKEDGTPYFYSTVEGILDENRQPISVVIKSYKLTSAPFNINPEEWEWVVNYGAKLLVYTPYNGSLDIVEVPQSDLISDQSHIKLEFSTENLDYEQYANRISQFAEILHYFKGLTFNFDRFHISNRVVPAKDIQTTREGKINTATDEDI